MQRASTLSGFDDLKMTGLLVEALDEPACLCDREGRLLAWNRAATEFWGATPCESDRWCIHAAMYQGGQPMPLSQLPPLIVLRDDKPVDVHDMELVRQDGSSVRFSLHAAPVRDETGVTIGVLARVRDLSTQRDLELARGTLTAIVQTSDDAIISMDLDGMITSWNRGAERLYGYEAQEIVGRSTSILIPANRKDEEAEVLARVRRGTVVDHFETVRRRKDGSEVAVSLSVSPMLDARGKTVGASKIARDVTDRQAADLVQNRLAAIVESSDDAIVSKDLRGTIVTWNRGAERLFGYRPGEIIGKSITTLIPPERLDEETDVLAKIVRGESVDQFETVRRRKDGTPVHISLTVSPIRDSKGIIVGASKIARDITERKRAEQRMADADRRKDEFLATLSHELRNPLAPLRTGLELLSNGPVSESVTERMVAVMRRQVDHLIRLVDDLLEVSRISRGVITLEREPLALAEVLQDAVEISRPLLDRKRQTLVLDLPPAAVDVLGDRVRLVQVFTNVLNNASKFSFEGGRIAISLQVDRESAILRIIDDGIGIDPRHAEAIFEMFFQVGEMPRYSGMGVGLSVTRRLVEMHGGSVAAKSGGIGRGTEIHMRLPLYARTKVSIAQVHAPTFASISCPRKLLIVDDNRDAAESLGMLLGTLGHEVHLAHDGIEAVQVAEKIRPEIVLLDIGMPGMSGYEVAQALRARKWNTPLRLIALTGWGQPRDLEQCQAAGFDHHLIKPVAFDRLLGLLEADGRPLH